ncbi:MAG: SLC13 family permease [Candidatus Sumerlaeaceae bacterium]
MAEEVISEAEERFERIRKTFGLIAGPIILLTLILLPMPGLRPEAHRLAAVLGFVITWWVCEPVPLPVTALLGPALCIILGAAGAKELLASFGDPIIFVFLGSFILAQSMTVHGLDRRIALTILGTRFVGNSTPRLIFAFGAVAAFLSMWLSNTATTAMLLPVASGILGEVAGLESKRLGHTVDPRRLRLATGLMLMLAYSASVGGIGTPIGTPPNLIGIGMIERLTGTRISFTRWMSFAVPMVLVMYLVLYVIIMWMHKPEVRRMDGLSDYLLDRKRSLGSWTRGQVNTLVCFSVAILLWITPAVLVGLFGDKSWQMELYSRRMPEGVAALIGAGLLFVLPVNWQRREFTLRWREATEIDWGTIFLFGAGIALGDLASRTGLAHTVGHAFVQGTGVTDINGITFLAVVVGIVVSEATSNTAAASIVIPVVIAVCKQAGIDPVGPAIGACIGASYGFMLPVSTAPNALVYGTGMVPITKMAKTGFLFDIVGAVIIWGGVRLLIG